MDPLRQRIRHAQMLHTAWSKAKQQRDALDQHWHSIQRIWTNLTVVKRQLDLARQHGLQDSFRSVQDDFRGKIDELLRGLPVVREATSPTRFEPSLRDWMNEWQALEDEFGNLRLDSRNGILSVCTESITLKDVDLGRFAIELHFDRLTHLRGSSCFVVVARDPNPASGRDEVTHPHVNDGDLCAGDAMKPIEQAMADGRWSDAFVLIATVLRTYNPRSPYVSLDEWDGISCGDCSGRVHRENSSYCDGCYSDLCDGCASMCRSCEDTRCAGCLTSCDGCSDLCCSRCLEDIGDNISLCRDCRGVCSDCNKVVLNSDLDEGGRCPACVPEEEPESIPEEIHAS